MEYNFRKYYVLYSEYTHLKKKKNTWYLRVKWSSWLDQWLVFFKAVIKLMCFKLSPLALAGLFCTLYLFSFFQISGSISPKPMGYVWLPYDSFTCKFRSYNHIADCKTVSNQSTAFLSSILILNCFTLRMWIWQMRTTEQKGKPVYTAAVQL